MDEGRPRQALRRLAEVCDVGERNVYRAAMPLVLYRMAETASGCGERDVAAFAAAALAELDPAAPMNVSSPGWRRRTQPATPLRRAGPRN